MVVPTFHDAFVRTFRTYEQQARAVIDGICPRDPLHWVADPVTAQAATRTTITGRTRHRMLNQYLDSFKFTRSIDQRRCHRAMTQANLAHLYRTDLDSELDALLEEFGVDEFKKEVLVIMSRRRGKSVSVAMFCASLAMAIEATDEPFVQSIFSTGRRASEALLHLIHRFLIELPNVKIVKRTQETIWIQGPHGPNDIRKINSYPSKVRSFLFLVSRCSAQPSPAQTSPSTCPCFFFYLRFRVSSRTNYMRFRLGEKCRTPNWSNWKSMPLRTATRTIRRGRRFWWRFGTPPSRSSLPCT